MYQHVYLNGGGGGRERILGRLCTVSAEPKVGLKLTNCEMMTQVEIKSQTLNGQPPRRPQGLLF